MLRSTDAGSLSEADVDREVTLAGWIARRRDHGGIAFLDFRDASGVAQVVVHDPEVAHPLRNEYCIRVVGRVSRHRLYDSVDTGHVHCHTLSFLFCP